MKRTFSSHSVLVGGLCDEVDEPLDRPDQGRFEVPEPADAGEHALPAFVGFAPAQRDTDAFLPLDPARNPRPRADPTASGFTACQMSMYGWPVTSTCSSRIASTKRD